ncbi:uncharacterized protein LOC119263585 isoform X4 [Pygocentrus nattereri]|uniref:uncharacterized protein LOC119263585 isoform X4 n=1 Tax=Pygocentrus nattereri TaxID=42514 RepID=UPI001890F55C|nr:uncharacterized protein LOC119263585 isoform X4 [Pygocentrus nattereri]
MGTRWGICSAGNISHGFVVALKTPSPEDHQALRTHFFVSVEVKELLSHGDVGEFVLMVYRGERPESIQATGYKLDAGVQ